MGVKGKPDTIDTIQQKRLQWYGHVKRMAEERMPKLIVDWIPRERRKRGRARKTWMEGVQAATTTVVIRTHPWTHYLPASLDNLPAATAHTNTRL